MRLKMFGILGLGLTMASGLAAQQTTGFDCGGSISVALDALKVVTNQSVGSFGLEAGYTGHVPGSSLPFRSGVAFNNFTGTTRILPVVDTDPYSETWGTPIGSFEATTNLRNVQVFGEVLIPTGADKLSLVFGLSLNKWQTANTLPAANETETLKNGTEWVKGVKMGARIGLDYQFNAKWHANMMLQSVELGTDQYGTKGINPSWIQLGVRYTF